MKVSGRIIDLNDFFPFDRCGETLRQQALATGKCVKYEAGEAVLLNGSPAKHCGLIVNGEAVAFKLDSSGRRYQLCLEEGCYIGLESLTPESGYTAKITALTDLEVFFWSRDGLSEMMDLEPGFADAMRMLDDGRIYQEQWLIPETDITDPVLCSLTAHWLSIIAPALLLVPVLLVLLAACAVLIRRYPAAWLLVFALLGAAGSLLYRQITARSNERLIVTSKNLILLPKNDEAAMTVARLSGLQSLSVEQNLLGRLADFGKISFLTEDRSYLTPPVACPALAASLIRRFAERAALGRPIPLRIGKNVQRRMPAMEETAPEPIPSERNDTPTVKPFRTEEFHPHWMFLVRRIFGSLLFILAAVFAAYLFRNNINADFIQTVLFIAASIAAVGIFFKIQEWRNNRFVIGNDCVRDYTRKPFSNEEVSMAMLHKIESVRFEKKGFFQLLFNYGTVYILAGEGELTFDYVSDPQKVQGMIMDACTQYEENNRMEEEARRRAYISDLVREIQNESSGYDRP